jgi:NAD(P)-dependent dehydrogenase (short-subunit alcohol dehydrogenase family)
MVGNGNTVVITGASLGIGRATAIKLASEGYDLILSDIIDTRAVLDKVKCSGNNVFHVIGDISESRTIDRIARAASRSGVRLAGVVNSAFAMVGKPFLDLTGKDWQRTFDVTFFAPVMLCRKLIPLMVKNGGGSIVNISSVHALAAGDADSAAYDSAKAAMNALTRSIAFEFGPLGIRANSILPGLVNSERILRWKRRKPVEYEASCLSHALGRAGKPEEIAEAVSFLISDRSSFVTGSSMLVDGGQMTALNETTAFSIIRKMMRNKSH